MSEQISGAHNRDPFYKPGNPEYEGNDEPYKRILQSVAEFDPAQGEEVFLSYSLGFEHGPAIERTGYTAPAMRRSTAPWEKTTDAIEQREGTWFIDAQRQTDALNQANQKGMTPNNISQLRLLPVHEAEFQNLYPDREIIGHQGSGDLTMNLWYVAYVNAPLTKHQPRIIHLHEEPINDRTYTCLVKWRSLDHVRVTIERDVRFNVLGSTPKDKVRIGARWVGDEIEFAVFGKHVIRDGEAVDLRTVSHQYSDLRHLLALPTINPGGPLFAGDPGRPRFYYGREWQDHVWFGEAQLLEDRNLQRAALVQSIILNRLYRGMGASVEQVRGAMTLAKYQEELDPTMPLAPGKWRFIPEDDNLVEVWLRLNRYPYSMIGAGVGQDKAPKVFCYACSGHQGRSGYTVQEAAKNFLDLMKQQGATLQDALMFDEGNDVFQKVLINGQLTETVPLRRRQLRATFIFGREHGGKANSA